jgi:3-deoxy-D-manno-octulosonate 8-phosphate phosphatase (KDO 8-P phosphatase)
MEGLGVAHVYQGQREKLPAYEELTGTLGLADAAVAYVGDDVIDLPVMRRVGLAIAVADAHPLVRRRAHWCAAAAGGRGAAREVCELVMEAQGTLQAAMDRYL